MSPYLDPLDKSSAPTGALMIKPQRVEVPVEAIRHLESTQRSISSITKENQVVYIENNSLIKSFDLKTKEVAIVTKIADTSISWDKCVASDTQVLIASSKSGLVMKKTLGVDTNFVSIHKADQGNTWDIQIQGNWAYFLSEPTELSNNEYELTSVCLLDFQIKTLRLSNFQPAMLGDETTGTFIDGSSIAIVGRPANGSEDMSEIILIDLEKSGITKSITVPVSTQKDKMNQVTAIESTLAPTKSVAVGTWESTVSTWSLETKKELAVHKLNQGLHEYRSFGFKILDENRIIFVGRDVKGGPWVGIVGLYDIHKEQVTELGALSDLPHNTVATIGRFTEENGNLILAVNAWGIRNNTEVPLGIFLYNIHLEDE